MRDKTREIRNHPVFIQGATRAGTPSTADGGPPDVFGLPAPFVHCSVHEMHIQDGGRGGRGGREDEAL